MLTKLSNLLYKYVNGWLVLIFLAGDVFFNAVVLPRTQANMQAGSVGGTGPIDLQFFYTPERVYKMVADYGPLVRAKYRAFELTGDIIYPVVYTLFFSLLLTWLFQRGLAPDSKLRRWNIAPFGAWLFDLFENLAIVTMLSIYPATPPAVAWLATMFTMVKWSFAGGSIALVLVGLVLAARNRFKLR